MGCGSTSPPLPGQVVHLFLCPQPDDLAWVEFAEAVLESVVVFNIAVPVLEFIQRGFEHLQYHLFWHGLLLQPGHTQNQADDTPPTGDYRRTSAG